MADIVSLYRYLDTNGDDSGTKNAVGDYSSAAEDFYIQPSTNDRYELARLIVSTEDSANMRAEHYGTLGAALTNGIDIIHEVSGIETKLNDGIEVKSNAGWTRLCYDVDIKTWGAGNELLTMRWTFAKAGQPLILIGKTNDKLIVRLNDSFAGLVTHYFMVQGLKYTNYYNSV